jgi:hypothetical protein
MSGFTLMLAGACVIAPRGMRRSAFHHSSSKKAVSPIQDVCDLNTTKLIQMKVALKLF